MNSFVVTKHKSLASVKQQKFIEGFIVPFLKHESTNGRVDSKGD